MKYTKEVYCPFGSFRYLSKISNENWTSKESDSLENGILINYIRHTYEKLAEEDKVFISKNNDYSIFNTGLFNSYYQPIYAYLIPNINEGKATWFLEKFGTSYSLIGRGISDYELPDRANYFADPSLLIFDTNCPINIQFDHILDDPKNVERLPDDIKNSPYLRNIFTGAVQTMINQVTANYKLAVPQFYKGKIQLLLPLCLSGGNQPDIALVVTKTSDGKFYQGHTCLTMNMAYNNARLIAKPESNWLKI